MLEDSNSSQNNLCHASLFQLLVEKHVSPMPAVPMIFGCWTKFAIVLASAGLTTLWAKKNIYIYIPVLLFILFAQKHACNVTYETESFCA